MDRAARLADVPDVLSRWRPGLLVALFSATMFTSAALLFLVQPMFAKMLLPLAGGTPAVWNVSMVFFQAVLLLGYLYAHASVRILGPKRQAALHLGLACLPLLVLPVAIPHGWTPPKDLQTLWLLALLAIGVGLPFFIISTTSPLLQAWFSQTRHEAASDPYFLYAVSNVGSLLALVAYPVLIEPSLVLTDQSRAWSLLYGTLLVLELGCAVTVFRAHRSTTDRTAVPAVYPRVESISRRRRLKWIAWAFVPSSMMLGVTTHLSTDIAAVPLLWIVPLVIYLCTFIVAFSPWGSRAYQHLARRLPLLLLVLCTVLLVGAIGAPTFLIPLNLATFAVVASVFHGRLSGDTPSAANLTQFYMFVAIGGVAGGAFNAFAAPFLFGEVLEYPLILVAAALLMPSYSAARKHHVRGLRDVVWAAVVAVLLVGSNAFATAINLAPTGTARNLIVFTPAALLCLSFDRRPVRFGLTMGAMLLVSSFLLADGGEVIYQRRNFFGVHHVVSEDGYHRLVHGNTIHGQQSLDRSARPVPLTYYHPSGPIGTVFEGSLGVSRNRTIGIIGLGTGSLACYRNPGEDWTFYEIDPDIVKLANNPRLFTFMRDCSGGSSVVIGDARLSLNETRPAKYGLLVIDAFSSDSIPVHLVTREAVELYRSRLAPGGVIVFHISNRYLDLRPVLGNLASATDMTALVGEDLSPTASQLAAGKTASVWVAMAPDIHSLAPLRSYEKMWKPLTPDAGMPVWTDDYSNILSVFRWR